ncbi:MAG: MerR family transcriptional regulator [Myxococcota bacterium]
MTQQANLSIGALAHATGVPTNTLRTWERRYGFPRSVRLPSGHRRYDQEQITFVRWIIRALEAGHRPSSLEALDLATLRGLVQESRSSGPSADANLTSQLDVWFEAVLHLDTAALEKAMLKDWSRHGAVTFLDGLVTGFLQRIGQGWADGVLSIGQEHAASETLTTFLSTRWRAMEVGATGNAVVLTTLPGERHGLGLHQAAVILAIHGFRIHFLGADTPLDAIVDSTKLVMAEAVMVSVSINADKSAAKAMLLNLRSTLPPNIQLIVGGCGAPEDLVQMQVMASMVQLDDWASRQSAGFSPGH